MSLVGFRRGGRFGWRAGDKGNGKGKIYSITNCTAVQQKPDIIGWLSINFARSWLYRVKVYDQVHQSADIPADGLIFKLRKQNDNGELFDPTPEYNRGYD